MKVSVYTCVRNGLFYDFHVADMLKHHLPLADEIVVNEGYSTDDTYSRISNIDPKIKVFRSDWGTPTSFDWFLKFKNASRQFCTGDWCIYLDCDEFIPDFEFDSLLSFLHSTDQIIVPLDLINFYANYKVYHTNPRKVGWPSRKMVIHRNLPDIEFWGDGSNVRLKGSAPSGPPPPSGFTCHHFGFVRNPARLRQKWRNLQGSLHLNRRQRISLPSFIFDWFPHRWQDPAFLPDLSIYDGPLIRAVETNPGEFVRDGFSLYEFLVKNRSGVAHLPDIVR
jgi:glycosyltransferase involved in cell wall biosynthesis